MSTRGKTLTIVAALTLFVVCAMLASAQPKADKAKPATKPKAPAALPFVPGSWTLVALPDTQNYSAKLFDSQTEWIAANCKKHNIVYVLHLGDITNNNAPSQWQVAKRAMSKLDGKVPYALAAGNHDYGPGGNAATRATRMNKYFPVSKFKKWPTFGGTFRKNKLDNSYHLFTAGGTDWIILALEWGPRNEVVAWANKLLSRYSKRRGILITHAYMYSDDTRYNWAKKGNKQAWNPHAYRTALQVGGVNDGEELWNKLVKIHPNMVMTLNGHVLNDGQARLTSKGDKGNAVHQVLVNYQMRRLGGEG